MSKASPKGLQIDWEAILRQTPADFKDSVKSWVIDNLVAVGKQRANIVGLTLVALAWLCSQLEVSSACTKACSTATVLCGGRCYRPRFLRDSFA